MSTTETLTQVVYSQDVTGELAPKDVEIYIVIDILQRKATFVCDYAEHVGIHEQRGVWFTASENCTLHVTDQGVFDEESINLFKGKPQWLRVDDNKIDVSTHCYVTDQTTMTALATVQPRTPPKIVVP